MGQIFYRTNDGSCDYGFDIQTLSGGEFEVVITHQPSYNGRSTTLHSTHRLPATGGGMKVCWSGPIRTVEEARGVARAWAEATQTYIRTGQTF